MARITLVDVAAHAGVSRATASLVVRESPLVAESTRERVQSSMRELGYVYDRAAAALRRSRTDIVGVVSTELSHPYLTAFVAGAQERLEAEGILVLTGVTHEDPAAQARLITALLERRLDGLVVIPANDSRPEDLGPDPRRVVQLVRRVAGVDTDFVGADNEAGGHAAAAHLLEHGATRLAFVGGLPHYSSYPPRLDGVARALADAGRPAPLTFPCASDREAAWTAARSALDAGADALVCFADVVAFGALDAAAEAGIRVPEDVRVIGFDDVPEARHSRPSLSSVATSGELAGREASALLLRRLAEPDAEPRHILVPTALVPRSSCGCTDPATTH